MGIFYGLRILVCILPLLYASITNAQSPSPQPSQDSQKLKFLEEAKTAYTQCTQESDYERAYDCKCVGGKFFEARMDSGDFLSYRELFLDSLPYCKSSPRLASYYYDHCISWSSPARRDAHEFCTCYGNAIGRNFDRKTFSTGSETESIMKLALKECNFRAPLEEEDRRNKRREKEKTIYERLFSSLTDNE